MLVTLKAHTNREGKKRMHNYIRPYIGKDEYLLSGELSGKTPSNPSPFTGCKNTVGVEIRVLASLVQSRTHAATLYTCVDSNGGDACSGPHSWFCNNQSNHNTIEFNGPTTLTPLQTIQITQHTDGVDSNDGLIFTLQYQWDNGPAKTVTQDTGHSCSTQHFTTTVQDSPLFPTKSGSYTLQVVSSNAGDEGTSQQTFQFNIPVSNNPPRVTLLPSSGTFSLTSPPTVNISVTDDSFFTWNFAWSYSSSTLCNYVNTSTFPWSNSAASQQTSINTATCGAGTYSLTVSPNYSGANYTIRVGTYTIVDITPTGFTGAAKNDEEIRSEERRVGK